MAMVLIGSRAMRDVHHIISNRKIGNDIDFIATEAEAQLLRDLLSSRGKVLTRQRAHGMTIAIDDVVIETFIPTPGGTLEEIYNLQFQDQYESGCFSINHDGEPDFSAFTCDHIPVMAASPTILYVLKMSHRFRKGQTIAEFEKTWEDIQALRPHALMTPAMQQLLAMREKETYTNGLPNLNQPAKAFFDPNEVAYQYNHDSLHELVALGDEPAYKAYQVDEVKVSKEKFFALHREHQLRGAAEEAYVLALERSVLRYPTVDFYVAFQTALVKLATQISSGWFREFVYENYRTLLNEYYLCGWWGYKSLYRKTAGTLVPYGG